MSVLKRYAKYAGDGAKPTRAYQGDAGFDLTFNGATPMLFEPFGMREIPCGVAIEWPDEHMWGLLVGRSSTFSKLGLMVNVAVIDAGFRGELFAAARNLTPNVVMVEPGQRVAQIVPLPLLAEGMDTMRVAYLSDSERGENGVGSSGR